MPHIEINLDETPLELPNISTGVHLFEITKYEEDTDDDGNTVHNFQLKCLDEGPDQGLVAFERFNFKYKPAAVKFKQFLVSAGMAGTGQGVDAAELVGKTVRGNVKPNVYTDKSGETVERTQIKKYEYKPA